MKFYKKTIRYVVWIIFIMVVVGSFLLKPYQATLEMQDLSEEAHVDDKLLLFENEGAIKANLILYPGGLVDFRAYASYGKALSKKGYRVFVVKMPLNLAILDVERYKWIQKHYASEDSWWLVGHSLGGTAALKAAHKEDATIDGVILLASYGTPKENFSKSELPMFSIVGSNDGIIDFDKLESYRFYGSKIMESEVLEGGNHSNFGQYGLQKKDNLGTMSSSEQEQITVEMIYSYIEKNLPK